MKCKDIKKGRPVEGSLLYFRCSELCLCSGFDRNEGFTFSFLLEHNNTVRKSEQGVIPAHAHVLAGVMLGSALTHDDVAGNHLLTAKHLDAKSFAF